MGGCNETAAVFPLRRLNRDADDLPEDFPEDFNERGGADLCATIGVSFAQPIGI